MPRRCRAGTRTLDEKLMKIAEEHSIQVMPLDPQTEAGKSLASRLEAEKVLLNSLEGDAWDKEYMTLVTNTQQSILKFSESRAVSRPPMSGSRPSSKT